MNGMVHYLRGDGRSNCGKMTGVTLTRDLSAITCQRCLRTENRRTENRTVSKPVPKKMIVAVSTDNIQRPVSRRAYRIAEVYVRPLAYGDLSEVAVSVWVDGKIHLTVKDKNGSVVDQYSREAQL